MRHPGVEGALVGHPADHRTGAGGGDDHGAFDAVLGIMKSWVVRTDRATMNDYDYDSEAVLFSVLILCSRMVELPFMVACSV